MPPSSPARRSPAAACRASSGPSPWPAFRVVQEGLRVHPLVPEVLEALVALRDWVVLVRRRPSNGVRRWRVKPYPSLRVGAVRRPAPRQRPRHTYSRSGEAACEPLTHVGSASRGPRRGTGRTDPSRPSSMSANRRCGGTGHPSADWSRHVLLDRLQSSRRRLPYTPASNSSVVGAAGTSSKNASRAGAARPPAPAAVAHLADARPQRRDVFRAQVRVVRNAVFSS